MEFLKMLFFAISTIFLSFLSLLKNRNNYIILLLTLELLLIGICLIFLDSSIRLDDFNGILSTIFLLTLGAIESAIGLTILIIYKKKNI
jgi:NADH:ubiquinone oxidoreductase subunit K